MGNEGFKGHRLLEDGWYWMDNEGNWQRYAKTAIQSKKIEESFKSNPQGSVDFTLNGKKYCIDFKSMMQTTQSGDAKRQVKRVNSKEPSSTAVIDPGQLSQKKEETDEVTASAAAASISSATTATNEQQWYWQNDDGDWCPYAVADSQEIESHYNNDVTAALSFSHNEFQYTIDLAKMQQTNNTTGGRRKLRRGQFSASTSTIKCLRSGYMWMWENDDGSWESYDAGSDNISSQKIETAFVANPNGTLSFKFDEHSYVIDLGQMSQKNEKTGKLRKIKRDPSPCRAVQPPLKVVSMWSWEDNDGSWKSYDASSGSFSSQEIESAFARDPSGTINFQVGSYSYVIDLKQMTQKNVETGKVRRIKRDSNTADVVQFRVPMNTIYPLTWKSGSNKNLQIISVSNSSDEFREVAELFRKTVADVTLTSVKRIQNLDLYDRFYVCKKQMEKRMGEGKGTQRLFHGTNKKNIDSICRQGFDFRLHTVHYFGKGSYFARDARYSLKYTDCNTMFLAQHRLNSIGAVNKPQECNVCERACCAITKVVVGDCVVGKQNMVRPPEKSDGRLYDTCVDNVSNPSIYVTFDIAHAYPEYLLEYK